MREKKLPKRWGEREREEEGVEGAKRVGKERKEGSRVWQSERAQGSVGV